MAKKGPLGIFGGVVVLLLVLAAGIGFYYYTSRQAPPLMLYGNVDIRTVNLSFRTAGRLESLRVDEGDRVKKGDLLGMLDSEPLMNALAEANANVASAQAQFSLLMAGFRKEEIQQARAAVEQQQATFNYADNFCKRQQRLRLSMVVSANDLENAKSARDQAAANVKSAQQKLSQLLNGNRPEEIDQAKAALDQAEARAAQARLNLNDAQLYAPSAGVILTRAVEPGTLLAAGSTALSVSLTDPVWVRAYVSERYLHQAVPGSPMEIYTDGRPNKPYHGKIGFVSPTAEFTPKSVETTELRTDLVYRLRVIVTDADEGLRQGMPVTLRLAGEAH